jgi:hypothetical protein
LVAFCCHAQGFGREAQNLIKEGQQRATLGGIMMGSNPEEEPNDKKTQQRFGPSGLPYGRF